MRSKDLLKELYEEQDKDAISDSAAQLSYYFLFALFPGLVVLATLAAYLPLGSALERGMLQVRAVLPMDASRVLEEHLRSLMQTRPKLLTFGLLLAIWSASRGVDALRRSLNLAYDVKESRAYWKTQALSISFTLGGAFLGLVSISLLIAGGQVGYWVADRLGMDTLYVTVVAWLRWPVTASIIMLAVALGYYFLPDVKQKFRYITPGSILATLVWLLGSWGFGLYATKFGKYNVTYGSLGGVMAFLTYLYLSGYIFLLGGELNAIMEHHSASGKAKGAREEGEVPPPADERPKAMPPAATKKPGIA